jgi:hypothetical protein
MMANLNESIGYEARSAAEDGAYASQLAAPIEQIGRDGQVSFMSQPG